MHKKRIDYIKYKDLQLYLNFINFAPWILQTNYSVMTE